MKEERLFEIINAQGEYIAFLGKEIARTAWFLQTHGAGPSEEVIAEGIELRNKIQELKTNQ